MHTDRLAQGEFRRLGAAAIACLERLFLEYRHCYLLPTSKLPHCDSRRGHRCLCLEECEKYPPNQAMQRMQSSLLPEKVRSADA